MLSRLAATTALALAVGCGGGVAAMAQGAPESGTVAIGGEASMQKTLRDAARALAELRQRVAQADRQTAPGLRQDMIAALTGLDSVLDRLEERPLDPGLERMVEEARDEMRDLRAYLNEETIVADREGFGDALQQLEDRIEPLDGQLAALGQQQGEGVEIFGERVGPAEEVAEPVGDLDIIGGAGAGREEISEPEPTEGQFGAGVQDENGIAEGGFGNGFNEPGADGRVGSEPGQLGIIGD